MILICCEATPLQLPPEWIVDHMFPLQLANVQSEHTSYNMSDDFAVS